MRGGEGSAFCGCGKSMTVSLDILNCELCPRDQSRPPFGLSIMSLRMLCLFYFDQPGIVERVKQHCQWTSLSGTVEDLDGV